MPSLKEEFPFRLIIGREDCTYLLDDNFTFSSADPGGFEAASFNIPKDMPETLRGSYVRMDSGLSVAFEGRVSEVQRSLGNKTAIQCEGNQALFKDNSASMVFVDRDLTQWQSPSVNRQVILVQNGYQLGSAAVGADPFSNNPALVQTITDTWTQNTGTPGVGGGFLPDSESWYDAGPENLIGSIYYSVDADASVGGQGNWQYQMVVSPDDIGFSGYAVTGNLSSTGAKAQLWTPGQQLRFAFLQLLNASTPGGVDGAQYDAYWSNLAVYGNHGLPLVGPAPYGIYPSAIAEWVLAQVPGLQPGVIPLTDSTGYIMPHSVYYTPVGLDQMLKDMATAAGWHWGVWESTSPLTGNAMPRLDFRPRPPMGTYTGACYRADTTDCDVREDLSQQYNRAIVSYSNVDGTNGVAIVTQDNPILDAAGIASRTLTLSGGTMTPATAAQFAAMALTYTYNEARVAGSVTIEQAISSVGGTIAPWRLKPGIDRLRIIDLPSTDAWGAYNDLPLQRMEFSGSSGGFSTQLDVGWGASMVETLQARLAAATALSAVGA